MKRIFYTVSEDIYDNGSRNGLITISVYHIVDGDLVLLIQLETDTDSLYTFEEEVVDWVDINLTAESFSFRRIN